MNDHSVLKGSLEFLGLAELLQQLGGSGATGVLKLSSTCTDMPGYVYFKEGDPVDAEYGKTAGLEALNRFFGWRQAEFEFFEEDTGRKRVIKKSRMEIILDGLRMVDEGLIPILDTNASRRGGRKTDPSVLPLIKGPVVDYVYVVDEEVFSDGEQIVAQDKFGNWFWVILEGTAEVVRILPEGPVPILRVGEGAYIGSVVSFLRDGNVRSASVYAVGRVHLGVLDADLIAREFSNLSGPFQRVLVSVDKRMRQLTGVCARLALDQKADITEKPRGKPFIGPDRNEDRACFIAAGEAHVYRRLESGYVHLLSLGPGDVIGRVPLLNTAHEPYSAVAHVSENFAAQEIDSEALEQEHGNLSKTFKNMIQHTSHAISVTTGRVFDLIQHAGNS